MLLIWIRLDTIQQGCSFSDWLHKNPQTCKYFCQKIEDLHTVSCHISQTRKATMNLFLITLLETKSIKDKCSHTWMTANLFGVTQGLQSEKPMPNSSSSQVQIWHSFGSAVMAIRRANTSRYFLMWFLRPDVSFSALNMVPFVSWARATQMSFGTCSCW